MCNPSIEPEKESMETWGRAKKKFIEFFSEQFPQNWTKCRNIWDQENLQIMNMRASPAASKSEFKFLIVSCTMTDWSKNQTSVAYFVESVTASYYWRNIVASLSHKFLTVVLTVVWDIKALFQVVKILREIVLLVMIVFSRITLQKIRSLTKQDFIWSKGFFLRFKKI